jgi:hypothetical protein
LTVERQLEALAGFSQFVDSVGETGLGVGLGVAGVGGVVVACTAGLEVTGPLGCVLAGEAAPGAVVGGYYVARSGVNELEEMFIKDCE